MSHTPHELAEDFPEFVDSIAVMRQTDAHFAKLTDEYHTVNRAIHSAETDVTPTSDDNLVAMRRKRMALKDQIYATLRQTE